VGIPPQVSTPHLPFLCRSIQPECLQQLVPTIDQLILRRRGPITAEPSLALPCSLIDFSQSIAPYAPKLRWTFLQQGAAHIQSLDGLRYSRTS
jgi:hypothetical protein